METLEEIFWKEGRFVNKNDKAVKTESIGSPVIIYNHERNSSHQTRDLVMSRLLDLQNKDITYKEANGYCLGEKASWDLNHFENDRNTSVQLYKISF
jgi:hypothetical protein